MEDERTSHYFHAEAHALAGKLKLPFQEEIKKQAFVKLEGQLADLTDEERAQRNYFSQHAKDFRLEGIISYASAHTQVSGHRSDKHDGASVTLATSVVENLNILNVVTADRVVAQISTTHLPGQYSPHVTFLGTHFENLRIARHKAEPYMKLELAGARSAGEKATPVDAGTELMKAIDAQYQRLKGWLAGQDTKAMRLTEADGFPPNKYYGFNLGAAGIQGKAQAAQENDAQPCNKRDKTKEWGGITCSLVEHVEIKNISAKGADGKSIEIPPPVKSFGHVIHIPDFGNIFLAELTVSHDTYNLTMIRVDMGCLAAGSAGVASCSVNGGGKGGGGGGT
jgi:hypothetical protein